jgi:hypothetical protein
MPTDAVCRWTPVSLACMLEWLRPTIILASLSRPSTMWTGRYGLSPRDPLILGFYLTKFIAYGILQDWEQALVWERRMEAIAPDHPFTGFPAAALLALAGHETEARETMQHYLGRSNILIRSIAQFKRVRLPAQIDNPRYLAWRNKFEEGLLRAGMPEE